MVSGPNNGNNAKHSNNTDSTNGWITIKSATINSRFLKTRKINRSDLPLETYLRMRDSLSGTSIFLDLTRGGRAKAMFYLENGIIIGE